VGASLGVNLYNEEKLRDFLLGVVSETERAAIEEQFLADEDFSAQVLVVEDELIESYLRLELSAPDRQRFEVAFLTQPRRRERVLTMKSVLAAANAEASSGAPLRASLPSVWTRVSALFHFQSAWARYAFAAALVAVMAFGAMLLFKQFRRKQDEQIVQQTPGPIRPEAGASTSPAVSPDISHPAPTPGITAVPRVSPSPTTQAPPDGPTLATIILRPTLVRDPSGAHKLNVTSSVKQVQAQLTLERNDYHSYAVRITTVEGRMVWQSGSNRARATNAGSALVITIPAKSLPADDYIVEVSGINSGRPPESIASYFFSITRK
jgi:anti-sigma-K factor RskA